MLCITRRMGEVVVLTDMKTGKEVGRIYQGKVTRGGSRIMFDLPPNILVSRGELMANEKPAA